MTMEHGLNAHVVMLCLNDLNITEENKNKNEDKFKFQDESARSQQWFDLDFGRIEENVSARDPDLYKKIYQRHDEI